MAVDDDRMPGVVPPTITRAVIERAGQIIHHLAFSFVAPLRAYNYNCPRHALSLSIWIISDRSAALCPSHLRRKIFQRDYRQCRVIILRWRYREGKPFIETSLQQCPLALPRCGSMGKDKTSG